MRRPDGSRLFGQDLHVVEAALTPRVLEGLRGLGRSEQPRLKPRGNEDSRPQLLPRFESCAYDRPCPAFPVGWGSCQLLAQRFEALSHLTGILAAQAAGPIRTFTGPCEGGELRQSSSLWKLRAPA